MQVLHSQRWLTAEKGAGGRKVNEAKISNIHPDIQYIHFKYGYI